MSRFVTGLSKKVLIANTLGELGDIYKAGAANSALAGHRLCFYAANLLDFSGYSDMAIGLGRIFGFHFPENFNYPIFGGYNRVLEGGIYP